MTVIETALPGVMLIVENLWLTVTATAEVTDPPRPSAIVAVRV
jgi:hypothetical protein